MADDSGKKAPEASDLQKIAAILLRRQVEFLVVRTQAEILMGSPRGHPVLALQAEQA